MFKFLIVRLSSSQTCQRNTRLGFLHCNASHIFNSFSSVVKSSESCQPKPKQEGNESLTVSYLTNSCGLSPKVSGEVSKRFELKNPDNASLVLHLFRSYGFSDAQISQIVKINPYVLVKSSKTLLPKLRFFESIGFSRSELPQLLISNCWLISWSLKERIIPGYEALKNVVDDSKALHRIIRKHNGWYFLCYDVKNMVPNIKVLREHGAPQSAVNQLLNSCSRIACIDHVKFVEHVNFIKEIGIKPCKYTFIQSLYVLSIRKKSSWESKLDLYERCGWARDVTLSAFKKFPPCMSLSEEKITSSIKFLVDEMGLSLNDIAEFPTFLGYSLKQRIIPRCSVFKILKMKGLIRNDLPLSYIIKLTEKEFLKLFVVRFQESVPDLLSLYQGQLGTLPEVLP